MAFSEIYVDPSIAADSGAGTVGDPYGDLEYAIEQSTFDTTNGTRVNIKAGTDEVLAAALNTALADTSVSIAWAPSNTAPLIFQGYTSTAGDGGVGGISGGGTLGIITGGAYSGTWFVDMHCHNCGSASVIDLNDDCGVVRCEINNTTGAGVTMDNWGYISQCYIHNVGAGGSFMQSGYISYNYFNNDGATMTYAVASASVDYLFVSRNVIKVDGASDGIWLTNRMIVENNSIWSNAGTGQGIALQGSGRYGVKCTNNIVEGFSGVGGVGFDVGDSTSEFIAFDGNAAYNNTTEYNLPPNIMVSVTDNETLTASPFTAPATNDFSPVDTGNVKEGSVPQIIGGGHV